MFRRSASALGLIRLVPIFVIHNFLNCTPVPTAEHTLVEVPHEDRGDLLPWHPVGIIVALSFVRETIASYEIVVNISVSV